MEEELVELINSLTQKESSAAELCPQPVKVSTSLLVTIESHINGLLAQSSLTAAQIEVSGLLLNVWSDQLISMRES